MAANYTALVAAWNGATQPPAGVAGTAITGAMTTAQKIAAVNSWTVTGTIPTNFSVTGAQVLNCINWTEFAALTAAQQSNLLMMCMVPGALLGGSSNTAFMVDGMILAYFTNHVGPTVTALTALANAQVQPWWATSVASGGGGLSSPVSAADTTAAGLS
jgi:hypothetical protein